MTPLPQPDTGFKQAETRGEAIWRRVATRNRFLIKLASYKACILEIAVKPIVGLFDENCGGNSYDQVFGGSGGDIKPGEDVKPNMFFF